MERDNLLENCEIVYIIVGSVVGLRTLFMANSVVKTANQDGWMGIVISVVYPLYITFIAIYLSKVFPKDNILAVSKKCFGNVVGSFFNAMFLIQFLIQSVLALVAYSNLVRVYTVTFLTPLKIALISVILGGYVAYKGIKVIARVSKIIFYLIIVLMLMSTTALQYGTLYNVMPVFGSGFINILKAGIDSVDAYRGIECIFLLYPFMSDKKALKKCGLTSVFICLAIFTWVTFITIYYLGPDVVTKKLWPYISVNESFRLPTLNNFRYAFVFFWTFSTFKSIAIDYYSSTYIISDIFKNLDRRKVCVALAPVIIITSLYLKDENTKRHFVSYMSDRFTLINFFYATIILIVVFINQRKAKPVS